MDTKSGKISIYFRDTELRADIELLANYDGVSLTELFVRALKAYVQSRADDIEFLRGQEKARQERREQRDQAAQNMQTEGN